MNRVVLMGRLTRDVEIRTANDSSVGRFTVAVNRRFKNAEGNYEADFISCVAFGKTAEFIGKFFNKGSMICLDGRIQTGSYTNKDGATVYTTEVIVDNAEFCGGKGEPSGSNEAPTANTKKGSAGFMNIPDGVEEGLPFN